MITGLLLDSAAVNGIGCAYGLLPVAPARGRRERLVVVAALLSLTKRCSLSCLTLLILLRLPLPLFLYLDSRRGRVSIAAGIPTSPASASSSCLPFARPSTTD